MEKEIIRKRIERARSEMRKRGVDVVVVGTGDPHFSEYAAERFGLRKYLTGFTGSTGTLVLTQEWGGVWTDSRYYIQAREELEGTGVVMMKGGMREVREYVRGLIADGDGRGEEVVVALNPETTSFADDEEWGEMTETGNECVRYEGELYEAMWGGERPEMPRRRIYDYGVEYAGESAEEKMRGLRLHVKEAYGELGRVGLLVSDLAEVAWVLNLRGEDTECTPVFYAYLVVWADRAVLFANREGMEDGAMMRMERMGIDVREYDEAVGYLERLAEDDEERIVCDGRGTSMVFAGSVSDVVEDGYLRERKAVLNERQREGVRKAMEMDGAAMVRMMMWIEANAGKGIRETDVAKKMIELRKRGNGYVCESFETIAGWREHGAVVHYTAKEGSDSEIKGDGMLLVDTGGNYLYGTTDITRTMCVGEATEAMRRDYTAVLRGHIALARAVFPNGCDGPMLDAIARQYLWREGMNYGHGTGHGVGSFMCVHEGPQGMGRNGRGVALREGMLMSDEPGVYKEGEYGIRIENVVMVRRSGVGEGFMEFETMSLCPYDEKLIVGEVMEDGEKEWMMRYGEEVLRRVSPLLKEGEREWLREKVRRCEEALDGVKKWQ